MRIAVKAYYPAILCALAPVVCYLLIRPYAEIGIWDDWAYVKMVQVLAQTGHIVYNGDETAMLGWQLYLGALFVKLFGFSFTVVRLSILPVAMATAFLLQRTLVRVGINQWNASLATLVFFLSPLCVPVTVTFMSDVPGVFCIVLCLYMCLRAVQSGSDRAAVIWLSLAALLNAVDGTVRQIAWLGVLVMVPSTVWLLRKRRGVLLIGGLSCAIGAGIVLYAMHWFSQQPYSLTESLSLGSRNYDLIRALGRTAILGSAEALLLMLPIVLMFARTLHPFNRRKKIVFSFGCIYLILVGVSVFLWGTPDSWIAPFIKNYLTDQSVSGATDYMFPDPHSYILQYSARLLVTFATAVGFLGLLTFLFGNVPAEIFSRDAATPVSRQSLAVILGPFAIAYICLLIPRASSGNFYDRYLLPLILVTLIALTLLYQKRVRPRLPISCVMLLAVSSGYSIAATHDAFAMYRGYVTAIDEIRSTGAPATAILGPWEFNGWTEIEKAGYVNDPRILVPRGANSPPRDRGYPPACYTDSLIWSAGLLVRTPAIMPVYGLSFNPHGCIGPANFPPVVYRTWIPPHARSVYIVKYPAASAK